MPGIGSRVLYSSKKKRASDAVEPRCYKVVSHRQNYHNLESLGNFEFARSRSAKLSQSKKNMVTLNDITTLRSVTCKIRLRMGC